MKNKKLGPKTKGLKSKFRAVRDAILSSRYRGRLDGFITMHTYSQIWIHPYGHKRDSYPGDIQDLVNIFKKNEIFLV